MDITDEQIEKLRYEAATHGDPEMVLLCDRALDGDLDALALVKEAILDAQQ